MALKISSISFYQNHSNEIERYIFTKQKSLHLVNTSSNIVKNVNVTKTVPVSFNNEDNLKDLIHSKELYDLIILTDLFEISDDIYNFLLKVKKLLKSEGKILITSINPKWNLFLKFFEKLKLKNDSSRRNYINPKKINYIAKSTGLELIQSNSRQIFPFKFFGIGNILNKILEITLSSFGLGIQVYSLLRNVDTEQNTFKKSIVVPAKNEEGNLEELINRIPKFENSKNEIVIICGKSKDGTLKKATELITKRNDLNINVLEQQSNGKANAVFEAFEHCNGDLIAILDSDLSVDPETLSDFFEIIENGTADFVNGTRLIYGKEKGSMQFLNNIGNLVFQFLISFVIKQKLTDSLCGTKVFKRSYLEHLYRWRNSKTVKDPFGDFDFIFSAAFSGQKILEYPVHYRSRKYGKTQISRFKDGWKLLFYFLSSFVKFNSTNNES
tara:strand:+ start:4899 stop:6221 length:1323 start_codon:yes stop_codon:yes gene_type:complete